MEICFHKRLPAFGYGLLMRVTVLLLGVLKEILAGESQTLALPPAGSGRDRRADWPSLNPQGGLVKTLGWPACLVVLCALAGHAQAIPPLEVAASSTAAGPEPPTISVNVRLVNVFVNVTDTMGAPIPGLTRDEFLLSEDDHPQKIAVFERQSELPLEIVLAIDTSGSVHKDLPLEHEAAKHFVHSLLRPIDHLDLMEFSDNVREVVFFTNNAGRVDRGLNDMGRGAATALYSGVYLASQSLAPRSGRKVLVIISDGGNTVKGTTYDQALEQALRGEVMVYPIIDVPIAASAGRDLAGEHALITLAQQTGGKYYYADSSTLDKTFAQLSEDLRTQYLLGYYPSNRTGSGFRTISVKLRSPAAGDGYVIRNRPGYYPSPLP
jgi:Ca-activated chloride channel homolog